MHHVAHTWRRRGTDMEATWAEAWMAQMCLGADRTAKVEGGRLGGRAEHAVARR